MSDLTLSAHDHGNCELCDQIEAQLTEREAELALVREVLNIDLKIASDRVLTLEIENQKAEAERADLVRALEGLEAKWRAGVSHLLKRGWLQSIRRAAVETCADDLAALRGRAPQPDQEPTP